MNPYDRYFVPFPTLKTERLTLRRIERRDAAQLYEYCRLEDSCRYSDWSPHRDLSTTKRYIRWMLHRYRNGQGFTFAVEYEGRVIGTASYIDFDENYQTVEIGYGLHKEFWGRGLGREAVNALTAYAFQKIGVHRISARVIPENLRSAALLTACGFALEGIHKQSLFFKGEYRDIAIYARLKQE